MGLGLSLGREVGNDGVQSSYVLANGDFGIRAGSGTLQQVGTNSLSNAFAFATSGVQAIELSTFVSVPAITTGSLIAEYRFSFDIEERTGDLSSVKSAVGSNSLNFTWTSSLSKANYDAGNTNLYAVRVNHIPARETIPTTIPTSVFTSSFTFDSSPIFISFSIIILFCSKFTKINFYIAGTI